MSIVAESMSESILFPDIQVPDTHDVTVDLVQTYGDFTFTFTFTFTFNFDD